MHPKGKDAVDPYPYIKRAPHLLVAAPPAGSAFTLRLTGVVVSADSSGLQLKVDSLMSWPSHLKQTKVNRVLTLAMPTGAPAMPATGDAIVAWTLPAPGTLAAMSGAPGALSLDRFAPR